MENLLDGWGITLATFSPLVGAAVMMLIPREREDRHKMVALVTSLWVAFVGVLLLLWFDLTTPTACNSRSTGFGSTSSPATTR